MGPRRGHSMGVRVPMAASRAETIPSLPTEAEHPRDSGGAARSSEGGRAIHPVTSILRCGKLRFCHGHDS